MENFFFPDSGTYSRHPFFPDNEVYSRRPFFPDSSTYSHHPFFPDTGASFFPDTGIYPRRPFADDKHRSTKPNWSATKHQSDFADNDRSRSRHDTSVPVHYANDKHHANDKHRTGFTDHKHRSTDDNSVPIHYAGNKHRSDFADHKHANDKNRSDYADHKYRSTKSDRSAAVIKIQKIVRGFLVRKDMRTVRKITAEIAEIGHQISALKFGDNAKQRLWIGEMLMALLLRLDAVRGVREYRKKVVRRVIQLQEAVDSIAQGRSVETADSIEDSMGKSLQMAEVTPSERSEESIAIMEAIESTAAENEALKRIVEELCERSQQQCDLLSRLMRRVEHLESRVQDMEQREKEAKLQKPESGLV